MDADTSLDDAVEQARKARQMKHETLRQVIDLLASDHFPTQKALALKLWPEKSRPEVLLAEYKTGMRNGRKLDLFQLNSLHSEITFRIKRAQLPNELPMADGESPAATTEPPTPATPTTAPAPAPACGRAPSALMALQLKEIAGGHLGGQVHVMSLGAGAAPTEDDRWIISVRGEQLRIPLGYRARYTFGARTTAELGGRTFEFEIQKLDSRAELHYNGSPLWVGREITTTVLDLAKKRIIGRACSKSGMLVGPSSPALLWRSIMKYCDLPDHRQAKALDLCGLTHPRVIEVLAMVKPPPTPSTPPSHTIGSRSGGLSSLTADGSQLRRIGALAGVEFVKAMESISPNEPVLVFQQLMAKPSFRNRFLTDFQRQIFSPAVLRDRLLEEPFFAGMVRVYHALQGWKEKRRHLSLFAPYFPWSVTCTLFGVTQWFVYSARLHAGEFGAERPVPPSIVSFRLKPEATQFLADFVNRPELTQTVASNQGAHDWKVELRLRPEQLARKYLEIVPEHLRISRSEVLEYLSQKCFRLQRAKSCLCGLCEEHGWQNFEDLVATIKELGLGAKETAGFITRARQLQDYLKIEYRRYCTTSLQVAARTDGRHACTHVRSHSTTRHSPLARHTHRWAASVVQRSAFSTPSAVRRSSAAHARRMSMK